MGTGERRIRATVFRTVCGQASIGPREVADQSNRSISAARAPPPVRKPAAGRGGLMSESMEASRGGGVAEDDGPNLYILLRACAPPRLGASADPYALMAPRAPAAAS